jgi:hypothetical protein
MLLVAGCAQVGEISGGEEDTAAPKIIYANSTSDSSTNFKGQSITLVFNEFFELKNPNQNIVMVPKHAVLDYQMKQKELKLFWKDSLTPNTTYVIYLNDAIKDITEGNDSLYTFVFSTGDFIDSLSYKVEVKDAWTNQPVSNCTVGLFSPEDSLNPIYFSKTNSLGIGSLNYLKQGNYKVRAFMDQNGDLTLQEHEKMAFQSGVIALDNDSQSDTSRLRLFQPKERNKTNSFQFYGPGLFALSTNYDLSYTKFFLNKSEIGESFVVRPEKDSILLLVNPGDSSMIELILNTRETNDTINLRISDKEKQKLIKSRPAINLDNLYKNQSLIFNINAHIDSIKNSSIEIETFDNRKIPYHSEIDKNQLKVFIDSSAPIQGKVFFNQDAFYTFSDIKTDTSSYNFEIKEDKSFGSISIIATAFEGPIILELFQKEITISRVVLSTEKKHQFEHLIPGEYRIRIIEDQNNNANWDTGNVALDLQPELVYWYNNPIKVRSNWDVEVELTKE